MKNLLLTGVLTLAVAITGYANASQKHYSLALTNPDKPAAIEIELHSGSVNVLGFDGKTIEITATSSPITEKEGDGSKHQMKLNEKVRQGLNRHKTTEPRSTEGLKSVTNAKLHLEIEEVDNDIHISSETMSQHIDLMIKVPFNSSLVVEVYQGGDIVVEQVKSSLELKSYQGSIIAKQVSGPIVAETYTTDIIVEFNDFDDVTPTSLTSHSGHVDITLAKSIKANINVQTYQGEIFSGLSQEFTTVDEIKHNNKGKKQKITLGGTLQAKVNGGGQDLSLTTYIGNLYIRTVQ